LSTVTIKNDYRWKLDPRFGRFTAYVDGRNAGIIEIGTTLGINVVPEERHTIRVRLWWYLSSPLEVRLGRDETLSLHADVRKDLRLVSRMLRMVFRPFSSLYLGRNVG